MCKTTIIKTTYRIWQSIKAKVSTSVRGWHPWWTRWKPTILFLLGLFIGNYPNWYPLIFKPATFAALIKENDPGGYLVTCWGERAERYIVNLDMVLKVTNSSSEPIGISGYQLEAKPSGILSLFKEWQPIKRIRSIDSKSVFYAESLAVPENPFYLKYSLHPFDVVASSTLIEPGHSIEGWAFFQFSHKPDPKKIQLRLVIFDTNGHTTTTKLSFMQPEDIFLTRGDIYQVMPRGWRLPCN